MPDLGWLGPAGALGLIAFGYFLSQTIRWATGYIGDLKRANEALNQVNDRLLNEKQMLMDRLAEVEKQAKHSLPQLAVSRAAEAMGFEYINLFEQMQVVEARMTNMQMMIAWLKNGGNPEANWNEIVKFWNAKKNGN